jgi:predicted AAA+ superfamily ATPase
MAEYVPRALAATIRRALRTFPAVLVTGARQTGKTTLLRAEFGGSHGYASLDRPDVRARALADPVAFLDEHPAPTILDEIQYAPELLPYVKARIDVNRRAGQWLLSGSQSFPVMRGVTETLAGRIAVLTLDPLSTGEVLRRAVPPTIDVLIAHVWEGRPASPAGLDLGAWLLRGGFPEMALDPAVDRALWLGSYVQTYLERDVRGLAGVGDLGVFGRFLALVGARSGQVLNMADLARDLGIAPPTVRRWLSVLEASQLLYLLPPYHQNFGKRLVKSPKLYLLDPGLASFLLGLHTAESILQGPSAGPLVETAVVAEWIKAFRQQGETPALYYWRAAGGLEVDLVIERDRRLYGLEIKATTTPLPGHAASLTRWLALAGRRARGAVACRIDAPTGLRQDVRAIPWHLGW